MTDEIVKTPGEVAAEAEEKAAAAAPPKEPPTPAPTKSEDLISKANAAAARQEEANKETARLIEEQKALNVEKTLGGETDAGDESKKEETPLEYKNRVMKGGDINDTQPPPDQAA